MIWAQQRSTEVKAELREMEQHTNNLPVSPFAYGHMGTGWSSGMGQAKGEKR